MDGRRFDAFTRTLLRGHSRREFVQALSLIGVGAIAARPLSSLADTSGVGGSTGDASSGSSATAVPTGVGGSSDASVTAASTPAVGGGTTDGTGGTGQASGVCLPITRTASTADAERPPFIAEIYAGGCDSLTGDALYTLFDVDSAQGVVGVPPAVPIARSVTTIKSAIDPLLAERHSVVIASAADGGMIACGEVGGLQDDTDLAVGLRERNSSGYSGIADFRGDTDSTLVYIYLGLGLQAIETTPAAVGNQVQTTANVNLRAEPASDSAVIVVIPAGTTLEVTGVANGNWVPVTDTATGNSGYISAEYLSAIE